MPARFHKKTRKMRGSNSHGWGAKKKHRGSGSRAGKGASNWLASKRSLTYSYQKERLGKKGFVGHGVKGVVRTVDLEELERWALAHKAKEVDAGALGFDKVLGSGKLSIPLKIKANSMSELAQMKIKQAGGVAVIEQQAGGKKTEEA